jgi:hypothetical protein
MKIVFRAKQYLVFNAKMSGCPSPSPASALQTLSATTHHGQQAETIARGFIQHQIFKELKLTTFIGIMLAHRSHRNSCSARTPCRIRLPPKSNV